MLLACCLQGKTYWHVVYNPVVLVVHAHSLLDEGQLGQVVGLAGVVALCAQLVAHAGTLVEDDLGKKQKKGCSCVV